MKKFLSMVLSMSLMFGMTTTTFAADNNTADIYEHAAFLNFGFLPGMTEPLRSIYNKTVGFTQKLIDGIGAIGQVGYRISGISYGLSAITAVWLMGKSLIENIRLKRQQINPNVDEVVENLYKELQCIKGQEKPKSKLIEAVAGIIDERNEAKENGVPYKKGDVIYISGASGVGKSCSAIHAAKAIMGLNAKIVAMDSSCFDKGSGTSVKTQLLYMREQQKNNRDLYSYMDNSLAAKIAANPNMVLIFDEYDKWGNAETDEFLRGIMDKGEIFRDGERIDCSGLLVIVLSNEDNSSVTAANGTGVFKDDGTGSRTHMVHDKSFLNRLTIIEFDNLYEDDYEKIAAEQLKPIAERYKKLYAVEFDFGDVARKIAIKVAKMNQGAREISKILAGLRKAIIVERQKGKNWLKDKIFKVSYDENRDEFTLEEKTGDVKNEPEKLQLIQEIPEDLSQMQVDTDKSTEIKSLKEKIENIENEPENLQDLQEVSEGMLQSQVYTSENEENMAKEILENEPDLSEAKG